MKATLQYHWRVGRSIICKFDPKVYRAILEEFQQEYLICHTDTEEWRNIEEKFRNRWNTPHVVGALAGKHTAMKKPKKSGSEYFNYKGYFSLVFLGLVDAEYKFLWVNGGGGGGGSVSSWGYHHQTHWDLEGKIYLQVVVLLSELAAILMRRLDASFLKVKKSRSSRCSISE